MIQHVWSVLCRRAIIDQETNNISLIDSTERIQFGPFDQEALVGLAGVVLDLELVTYWVRTSDMEPARARSRTQLRRPNDDYELVGEPAEVDLREFERLRARMRLQGIPYRGPGRYTFQVETEDNNEWHIVAEVPLDVSVVAAAEREQS